LVDANRLGVFRPRQSPESPPDIGFINAFSSRGAPSQEQLTIQGIAAFMPRHDNQQKPMNDASEIVCARVFRAR
jgi:hypothetical protein